MGRRFGGFWPGVLEVVLSEHPKSEVRKSLCRKFGGPRPRMSSGRRSPGKRFSCRKSGGPRLRGPKFPGPKVPSPEIFRSLCRRSEGSKVCRSGGPLTEVFRTEIPELEVFELDVRGLWALDSEVLGTEVPRTEVFEFLGPEVQWSSGLTFGGSVVPSPEDRRPPYIWPENNGDLRPGEF